MTNPLLSHWDTPHQLPPFALIEDAHFAPAFEAGLSEARAAIQLSFGPAGSNRFVPTAANTIVAAVANPIGSQRRCGDGDAARPPASP